MRPEHQQRKPPGERAAYPVYEAAFLLGCSRGHVCNLIKEGKIKAIYLGRRTLVPASEIRRLTEPS